MLMSLYMLIIYANYANSVVRLSAASMYLSAIDAATVSVTKTVLRKTLTVILCNVWLRIKFNFSV